MTARDGEAARRVAGRPGHPCCRARSARSSLSHGHGQPWSHGHGHASQPSGQVGTCGPRHVGHARPARFGGRATARSDQSYSYLYHRGRGRPAAPVLRHLCQQLSQPPLRSQLQFGRLRPSPSPSSSPAARERNSEGNPSALDTTLSHTSSPAVPIRSGLCTDGCGSRRGGRLGSGASLRF